MCNQFIQKIFPEYLVCAILRDDYSKSDEDSYENEPWVLYKCQVTLQSRRLQGKRGLQEL